MTTKLTIRRALVLGAALLAGGALALPFASFASTPSTTKTTGTTSTTGKTSTTGTTGKTGTTQTTPRPKHTPPPPPSKPPSAYSSGVEQVTTTSALLKGTVNPHGLATDYYFQYGPTAAYGSQTPSASAGSAATGSKFTQAVTGLAPATTYHFRVVATNAAGATDGRDATFTTKKIPLTLTASVTPDPVAYGRPLVVTGTLSGTGAAGAEVVLQEKPFPYNHGFSNITGPQATNAAGGFSFALARLSASSRLRVATLARPLVYSPILAEPVTVHVTLHVRPAQRRGYMRLFGTVTPARPGALVAFERRVHGRYVTVSGTRVRAHTGGTRFARTVRRHRGRYRALVLIPPGPLASGRSRPVLVR